MCLPGSGMVRSNASLLKLMVVEIKLIHWIDWATFNECAWTEQRFSSHEQATPFSQPANTYMFHYNRYSHCLLCASKLFTHALFSAITGKRNGLSILIFCQWSLVWLPSWTKKLFSLATLILVLYPYVKQRRFTHIVSFSMGRRKQKVSEWHTPGPGNAKTP